MTSVFNYLILMFMILFGGFSFIDDLIRKFTDNPFIITLVFFGTIGFASALISLPFSIYDTYVVEEHFGFNRTSVRTFITDKLKGLMLAAIIGGALLSVFLWFYLQAGSLFWLYAWIMASLFSVFITFFYSTLIVPLFNRQTPLPEGELKDAINAMGRKTGFALDKVFVIDGSRRSTKANAYFSGFGRKKRIVLYDNLINDLSTGEITAVLAHEIGHYKKKHVITCLITGMINTGLILFILSLFIDNPSLSSALGSADPGFHMGLLSFGILYSPVFSYYRLFLNRISRKHEYEADAFVKETGLDSELVNALKKLSS
jgi:STE24 endopeptidase